MYRPYQQEAYKLELQDNIEAFNKTRTPELKIRKTNSKKLSANSIKKQEKITRKKAIKICCTAFIVVLCLISCLSVKAEISKKTQEINSLEKSNQMLYTQNQILETELLSNINEKTYYEYVIEDLGMIKNNKNIQYINVNNYKEERIEKNNGSKENNTKDTK